MPFPDPAETSWSLIERAAGGDGPARSRFGRSYLPLVRSILATRWRGTALVSEVDDATQETFLECFRPAGPLERADRAKGTFRDFLFGIARNVAARFEARAARGPRMAVSDSALRPEPVDRSDDFSQLCDREWARSLMREAGLLQKERAQDAAAQHRVELLRLRFAEGLPIRAIAAQWKSDVDAVHRSYSRAREEFRLCLRAVVARHAVRTEADLDAECRRLFELLAEET